MFMTNNLSVLSYAKQFTWWQYQTDDTAEQVFEQGYFDDVKNIINDCDVIFIACGGAVYHKYFTKKDNVLTLKSIKE